MIFKINKLKKLLNKNTEISFLTLLIIITIASTTFYNSKKLIVSKNYKEIINNIYFQKSINHIFDNLSPRYRVINHKVLQGEAFDQILKGYSIPDNEIAKIKKTLNSSYNLNNLKTASVLKFTIDQSDNRNVTTFIFPISRTEKIQLTKNVETENFEKKKIITNLNRRIVFKEGKILQSLYRTAVDLNIKPNIVIEFAGLYGFQVDFQRDIRKNDSFQIM